MEGCIRKWLKLSSQQSACRFVEFLQDDLHCDSAPRDSAPHEVSVTHYAESVRGLSVGAENFTGETFLIDLRSFCCREKKNTVK
jgi:ubiquitin C-terminal hydrolase